MAFAMGTMLHVSNFNAQELANTAWALAMSHGSEALVFKAFARAAELRLSEFGVLDLANMV